MKDNSKKKKIPKVKKGLFVCDIEKNALKIVKCSRDHSAKRKVVSLSVEAIPAGVDDKHLSQRLAQALKKYGYKGDPIIVALPQTSATARYMKIPSQTTEEIERIVTLQAPRYLPYPQEELISGHQVIRANKDGTSDINIIIVHKDIVSRYMNIFKDLKPQSLSIVLSSYGLCNLHHYVSPDSVGPTMLIDIDADHAELAITSGDRLLFSRYFKMAHLAQNREDLIIEEILKTENAYLREVSSEKIVKIAISGTTKVSGEFSQAITARTALPVEYFDYPQKIDLLGDAPETLSESSTSFNSEIGLGLVDAEETLNLIPQEMKEEAKKTGRRDEKIQAAFLIVAIIILWALGLNKNLNVKTEYLKRLKEELSKISTEAKPLEEVEKRFQLLSERQKKAPSSLDVLYGLYQVLPQNILLTSVTYEEDQEVILHGNAEDLNSVFATADQLERSPVFKEFIVKVRYATKMTTQSAETIDFEIACARR